MNYGKKWLPLLLAVALIGCTVAACDSGTSPVTIVCTHIWGNYTEEVAPDCETDGIETRTCTLCGITDPVTQLGDPALGHDWLQTSGDEPDCENDGHGNRTCQRTDCGEEEIGVFDALGHDLDWAETTPATCSDEGEETGTCQRLGCTHSETSPLPIDPDEHDWDDYVQTTEPTCEEAGIETRECTLCGDIDTDTQEGEPALGHDFIDNWTVTTAATASAAGEETDYCQRTGCSHFATRAIYIIIMQDDGNGTAEANHISAALDTPITITATPNPHYIFEEWQVISGGVTLSSTASNPVTFTMPANAVTIRATFEELLIDVLVTHYTKEYNGTPQGATVEYDGEFNEDNAGELFIRYVNVSADYDSAIPPTNAGTYYIMATTAGGTVPPLYPAVTDPIRVGTLIIARKDLTWATQGVVADKIYDRTTNTTVTTQPTLAGVIAGDTVTVTTDDIVVVFTSRNANTSVSVTASGYGVIGASIANYIVPSGQPPFTNAAINRKPLTWAADGEAADKPYDRTPAATAATQPTLVGVETGDTVTRVNGTVTFNNMNVGTDIGVTATGYGINGADADNYNAPVDQPVFATAAITAKTITITGVAATNRSFSPGNTTVAISGGTLVGVEPGDTVNAVVPTTGTIATADAENNKAVTIADITLSGAQTDNYALTQPSGLTVHITKADGAAVSVPVMTAHTHNSITVNATLAEATGQAIAYARNTTNEAPETGWQTDGVFTGLSSGTFYFFFARSVFNDNYETGDASAGAEIATLQAVPQNQFAYYWVNQQDILATTDFAGDGSISLSRGAGHTLTITADGTGYTDQRWSVNGINDASYPIGSIEYIFSAAGKTVGAQYTIGLRVVNGGRYYNTNFVVTITE